MKLWTIQPKEIYDYTMKNGIFITDIEKSYWYQDLKDAYNWYIKKMIEKISKPDNVILPIWAWYRWNGKEKKPDLRYNRFKETGDNELYALITLEVPDSEVLLSEYDNWHCVLNNSYLDTESNNEKEWDRIHDWLESLDNCEYERNIVESWDKIFNVELIKDPTNWRNNGFDVQATFWILKKEYIKDVQFFRGKKSI